MHRHIFFNVRKLLLCDIWEKKEEEETKILPEPLFRKHPCWRTQLRPSIRGCPTLTSLSPEPFHPFLTQSFPSHFSSGYSLTESSFSRHTFCPWHLWLSACFDPASVISQSSFLLLEAGFVTPSALHPASGEVLPTLLGIHSLISPHPQLLLLQ